MVFQKRGLSAVVATVLLLIITVAGVAIIAGFVIPFVKDSLEEGTACLPYQDYFSFEESFEFQGNIYRLNCHDTTDNLYAASIKSSVLDDEAKLDALSGFKLVFSNPTDSDVLSIEQDKTFQDVKMLNQDVTLSVPIQGGVQTYVYSPSQIPQEDFTRIEVFPLLKSGKTCTEYSDSITIIDCGVGEKDEIN